MATFRCLKSKETVNYNTGVDLGTTTTTHYTLINTPVIAGSIEGTIYDGAVAIQTFAIDIHGVFQFANIGNPTTKVTAGSINLGTGAITLTWNANPGTNHIVASYIGLPVYMEITKGLFYAKCAKANQLCNSNSNAYVAASTMCSEKLYI